MPRRQSRRQSPPTTRHEVRIIGGRWRGRKIRFPDSEGLRPTGDRIRETLFNWLAPWLPGARCLDLFAGSGALGFEALSRGAAQVVMLEKSPTVVAGLKAAATALDADETLQIIATDTRRWLKQPACQTFDIIFLDPPFATDYYSQLLTLLRNGGWLTDDTLLYMESDRPLAQLDSTATWEPLREKRAGVVYHGLYGMVTVAAIHGKN